MSEQTTETTTAPAVAAAEPIVTTPVAQQLIAPAEPAPATKSAEPAANPWEDPATAKAEIERLRKENGSERVNAKKTAADEARNELAQQIGKALGLVKADEAPTAEQLTALLEQSTNDGAQARLELAIYKAAADAKADAAALLDSRAFLEKTKGIDPTDSAALAAAITEAVTENPRLKTAQAAGSGGADFTGGTGETAITQDRFNAMTPAEKNTLFNTNPTLYRQLTGR